MKQPSWTEYQIENCKTGEKLVVLANDRKSAHEVGTQRWPMAPIEVTTTRETHDRAVWRRYTSAMEQDLAKAYEEYLPDSDYPAIQRWLDSAIERLASLKDHFRVI